MGADTLRTAVVCTGTLRAGVGGANTLGTDVVFGDTLGAKRNVDSDEVVRCGEYGSIRTGGGKGKER